MTQHELFRRGVEVPQVLAAFGGSFEQGPLFLEGYGNRIGFRENNIFHHRLPAAPDIEKRCRVFFREPRNGFRSSIHIGKPAQVRFIKKVVHHARIGLVVMDAEILQLQIFVPGKHHQAAMKHRMNVVPEARIVAVLMGVQTAAHFHVLFHDHNFLAALG